MPVAPCGKGECAALADHRKAGTAQPQRLAQGGTLHRLPADRQAVHIAGGSEHRCAEPLRLLGEVSGDAQPLGQQLLQLGGGKVQGVFVVFCGGVSAAVHRYQIGQGGAPDILAGLGAAIGHSKVACSGGGVPVIQHLRLYRIHQRGKPGVVGRVAGAPVTVQHCIGQAALPPGGVCGEPCAVFLGAVIPAVEGIAVRRHCLCLQCFVRPADRHFGGNGSNQVLPQWQCCRLPGALIRKADGISCVSRGGGLTAVFFRSGRGSFGCGRSRTLRKGHAGKAVGGTRQHAAQHQQNGTQQQKGTFHTRPPPGTQALGTSYARQRANRREMRRETPVFLRFAVRSVHLALEFTAQKRYYKSMSIRA